jgi:hypothetical protein
VRLAYADPPYPGQAKRHYGDQPNYGGEVDHVALVASLAEYDGWALSTSAAALQQILVMCPPDVRVGIWHVTNSAPPVPQARWWWSWEPVIVRPARRTRAEDPNVTRDLLPTPNLAGFLGSELPGHKPKAFCEWVFRLVGAQTGDTLDDLFPGSGAVSRAWETFTSQLHLVFAEDVIA